MTVTVLRLGHRVSRDKRITTHLSLVARAFGADKMLIEGEKDERLVESITKVSKQWGGCFKLEFVSGWRSVIKNFPGKTIHLTMYGLSIVDVEKEIVNSKGDFLVIVGGAKVPSDIYELVDFNISVGCQPHSEVSSLAILLDRIFQGKQFSRDFSGGKKIIPQAHGKMVVD